MTTRVALFCTLAFFALTRFAGASRMCEHVRINMNGDNIWCCFNEECCDDREDLCRKVEISDTEMKIVVVKTSNVECALMQLDARVCCDNRNMACDCPDGYEMCNMDEGM